MLDRVFLFAAFAALAAAQDLGDLDPNSLVQCTQCGDRWTCCSAEKEMVADPNGGFQCYDLVSGSSCNLCEECPPDEGNAVTMVNGATSTGGFSVGEWLYNGMKGFKDVPGSRFSNFPRFMRGSRALVFDKSTEADWYTVLKCYRPPCDIYVFVYRTQRCTSEGEDEMHDYMVHAKQFHPNPCGPTFQLTPEGHEHQYTTYHRELLEKDQEVVIAPGLPLDFAFIAIGSKRFSCAHFNEDPEGCHSLSGCTYNAELHVCETRWCQSEKCEVCPKLEDGTVNTNDVPRFG